MTTTTERPTMTTENIPDDWHAWLRPLVAHHPDSTFAHNSYYLPYLVPILNRIVREHRHWPNAVSHAVMIKRVGNLWTQEVGGTITESDWPFLIEVYRRIAAMAGVDEPWAIPAESAVLRAVAEANLTVRTSGVALPLSKRRLTLMSQVIDRLDTAESGWWATVTNGLDWSPDSDAHVIATAGMYAKFGVETMLSSPTERLGKLIEDHHGVRQGQGTSIVTRCASHRTTIAINARTSNPVAVAAVFLYNLNSNLTPRMTDQQYWDTFYPLACDLLGLRVATPADYTDLADRADDPLAAELAVLRQRHEGETMALEAEAKRREWCSEYDAFVQVIGRPARKVEVSHVVTLRGEAEFDAVALRGLTGRTVVSMPSTITLTTSLRHSVQIEVPATDPGNRSDRAREQWPQDRLLEVVIAEDPSVATWRNVSVAY